MDRKGFGAVAMVIILAAIVIAGGIIWYYKFYSKGELRCCIVTYSVPRNPPTAGNPTISSEDVTPSIITQPIDNNDLVTTSSLRQSPGMIDQGPVAGNTEVGFTSLYLPNHLSIQDFQTIVAWLQSYGLVVNDSGLDADGFAYIDVAGTAAQFDTAFHTQLNYYFDGRTQFIGVKGTVAIPAALSKAVVGPVFFPPSYPA